MMNEPDPRWMRSRQTLIAAVTNLLDAGVTPTITDVVEAAAVSRPTFYQHFGDLPTAFREAGLARVRRHFDAVDAASDRGDVSRDTAFAHATMTGLLTHLRDHLDFYRFVLAAAGDRLLTIAVTDYIAERIIRFSPFGAPYRDRPEQTTADQVEALSAGIFHLIVSWLNRPTPEPPADMADRLIAVMAAFAGVHEPAPRTPTRSADSC